MMIKMQIMADGNSEERWICSRLIAAWRGVKSVEEKSICESATKSALSDEIKLGVGGKNINCEKINAERVVWVPSNSNSQDPRRNWMITRSFALNSMSVCSNESW